MTRIERLRADVAGWFADAILSGRRIVVTHAGDPPWDASGTAVNTGEPYALDAYETLGDFLEEPNGNTHATYASGCGLHHETYADSLEERVKEHLEAFFVQDVGAPEEHTSDDGEDLWSDDLYDALNELLEWLMALCASWSARDLLFEGRMVAARAQAERRVEQMERDALHASARRVLVKYGLPTGPQPSGSLCKKTEAWARVRPVIARMQPEERKLVALVLTASCSIIGALTKGEVP